MNILRSSVTIAAINPLASSTYSKAVMGEETVTLAWEMPAYINLLIGDYITYRGVTFTLNRLPIPKKLATNRWSYTATFQAPVYELAKAAFLLPGILSVVEGEFSLTGTATDFLQLLVDNLNRVLAPPSGAGGLWFVGDVVAGDYKTLTFSGENCFDVLSRLATEFDTEYHVSGNTVHLTAASRTTALVLEYGSTLYDIERVNIDSADIITRLYPFGSEKNIAADYRDGSKRLLIPAVTGQAPSLEANTNLYGVIEGSKTFDDIYPRLSAGPAGTVTAIGADIFTFTDSALDFNINSQLIPGTPAKLRFLTGDCAGYDLEIASYNNTTKTFSVIANVDDKDFAIPNVDIFPAVGDTYVLLDIIMPAAYVTAAEAELLAAATDYLTTNSHPRVTYRGNFSSLYAKVNDPDIRCGDLVQIVDANFGIDQQIRIVKLNRSINEPWNIQYDLSDTVVKSTLQRMTAEIERNERSVIVANRELKQNYNRAYRNMAELRASVFDTDGYFDPTNIKPLSIETTMLSVGAKSQTLQTNITFYPNYLGVTADFSWSAGSLIHFTIADEPTTWNVASGGVTALNAVMYYIYIKCSHTTNTGEVFLSIDQIKFDTDPDYYYFLVGILHTPVSGVRGISLTYGQTTINGQFIRTGVISSIDGNMYFDLTTGEIRAGQNGEILFNSDGSGQLAAGNITWNAAGDLTVKGEVEATSGLFGLLKILGNSIIGEHIKITDGALELKSVATGEKTTLIHKKWELLDLRPPEFGSEVSMSFDSEEITIETSTTLPTIYAYQDKGHSLPFIYTDGDPVEPSCIYKVKLQIINNGIVSHVNESAGYNCKNGTYTQYYTNGTSIAAAVVSPGTVKFRVTVTMSSVINFNDWNKAEDILKIIPIITDFDVNGDQIDISVTSYVKRAMFASDGMFAFTNQNRYLYFRGANDANDLFEVRLGNYILQLTEADGLRKSTDGGSNWTGL